MEFRELRRRVVSEEIVQEILSMIQDGRLNPGDKLPSERQLAVNLNVSRPSLREAMRALSAMNVVDIIHGDGVYVTTLEPERLFQHFEFVFSLDDSTFLQLFEARKIVEVGFAELAAANVQDTEIEQLENLVAQSEESVDDPDMFLQIDAELHEKIAEIAHNPILQRLMAGVSQLSRASRRRTAELPGVREETIGDHRAIVAAIAARDTEAARLAMLRHLERLQSRLKETALILEEAVD
jgi:GntR family transcriptional regulator, transcriptional repressor for pyruvate dehydrogenase complex